jgi:hypothetical protein
LLVLNPARQPTKLYVLVAVTGIGPVYSVEEQVAVPVVE